MKISIFEPSGLRRDLFTPPSADAARRQIGARTSCPGAFRWLRWRGRAALRANGGVSALEFAIIAPVAILVLFGLISYGLIFTLNLELQHLLAETGRSTIPGLNESERRQLAAETFEERAGRYPFLDASAASLQVEDDGRFTRILITYDPSDSPAWLFEGLLPLPEAPFVFEQTIRNGGL